MHPPQGPGGNPPGNFNQPQYPPQQGGQSGVPVQGPPPGGGFSSAAAKKRARRAEKKAEGEGGGALELILDKSIDFALIFVGLYAATALQRCQDTAKEKQEYVSLLSDFKRELEANRDQEKSIAKDLGPIEDTKPGENLGPWQVTFKHFFEELEEDEKVVHCLHDEFLVDHADAEPAKGGDDHGGDDHGGDDHAGEDHGDDKEAPVDCHALYAAFDKAHAKHDDEAFSFKPAVLTPFYRKEVWQLYLADGVKTFRNKELAVKIAEVYANATLIEEQVADIEGTYNDAFMAQVGKTMATDMELAEVVHDEEAQHGLSEADKTLLVHVDEAIKDEHYATLEVERTIELKVERMKNTVLKMRKEIEDVQAAIDEELEAMGKKSEDEGS